MGVAVRNQEASERGDSMNSPPKRWFESRPEEPQLEIVRLRDFHTAFKALRVFGLQRGMPTGWRSLDEFYSVRPREWTLVTGIPSHGKSTWLDALMVNLADDRRPEIEVPWRWAVFSSENWPLERHAATLVSQYIGKPLETMTDLESHRAEGWLDKQFAFLCPREDDYTIDRILDLAHIATLEDSLVRGIVIDPWNELDHSRQANLTETEYVSRALTKIRRFTRSHEVHVFLVAHPTKLKAITTEGNQNVYPVPTPYDVSGSAHFRNKADCCVCVWRDVLSDSNETDVHIQKIRFREVGKVGMCRLKFNPYSGRFSDLYERPTIRDYMDRREPGEEG